MALGLSQVVTWSSSLLLVLVLPTYLGDVGFGKMSVAFFLASVIGLTSDLGANSFLTKDIARQDVKETAGLYVYNALLLRLPLVAVGCLLGVIFVNALDYDSQTRAVFYVLIPSILLGSITSVFSSALTGIQRIKPIAWSGALSKVVYSATLAILVMNGYGVVAAAAVSNLSSVMMFLIVLSYARTSVPLHIRLDPVICKAIFYGGLPFLVWQASLFVYGQIDILQLSLMSNEAVVGWYSAAYQLVFIPAFIPTIIMTALFPLLSKLAQTERAAFISVTRRCVNFMVLAVLPISVGTAILAPAIVDLFGYPAEFDNSIPLIAILAFVVPSAAVGTALGTCLNALDRQRQWAVVGVFAAILNPLMNFLAIPLAASHFDNAAIGASITSNISEYLMLAAALWLLPRDVLSRAELKNLALCLVAGGIMAACVWPLRAGNIGISVLVGAGVYAMASLALGTVRLGDALQMLTMLGYRKPKAMQTSLYGD